jgi:ribonuclease-3
MRAQLVRRATLAEIGDRLKIGSFLVMGRGEERSGGRRRAPNLEGAFEAIVGAVYLDAGLGVTRDLIERHFESNLQELEASGPSSDAKSSLQRFAQARLRETPEYVTVATEGTADSPEFIVEVHLGEVAAGTGRGRTKRQAQQEAANQALRSLTDPPSADSTEIGVGRGNAGMPSCTHGTQTEPATDSDS